MSITRHGNKHCTTHGGVAGVVTVVPARTLLNDDMPCPSEADDAARMTGVRQRRHIAIGHTLDSIMTTAGRAIIERLGWERSSIDLLIVVTQTQGRAVPADVHALKQNLGLRDSAVALQANWSCAGYVYALWLAMTLLQSLGQRAVVVVGDLSSTAMDPADRATYPLFGDAISATAITSHGPLQQFVLGSSGLGAGGLVQFPGEFLKMDGASVFNFTLQKVPPLIDDVLTLPGWAPEFGLFHQANSFMLRHLLKKSAAVIDDHAPGMRVPINIERFGNCSSASIPLLMCTDIGTAGFAGKMLPVMMIGYGAGWAWSGARVDCTGLEIADLVEV